MVQVHDKTNIYKRDYKLKYKIVYFIYLDKFTFICRYYGATHFYII